MRQASPRMSARPTARWSAWNSGADEIEMDEQPRGRLRKGRRRADERHQAFGVLLVILQALDGEETDTQQRRDEKTAQDGCACPGPRRGHRERDEEARGQQHRRVGAPEPNVQVLRRGEPPPGAAHEGRRTAKKPPKSMISVARNRYMPKKSAYAVAPARRRARGRHGLSHG